MGNIVTLNDSTFIRGKVTVSTYTIQTRFGNLEFSSADISYIQYRSPANAGKDELFASDGSSYYGEVFPEIITIEVNSQELVIPKSDIHSIVLFVGRGENISADTKAKLSALDI